MKRERNNEYEHAVLLKSFEAENCNDLLLSLLRTWDAPISSDVASELLLLVCSKSGSSEALVRALLVAGADPNCDSKDMSLLHLTALNSSPEVVALLLQAGAVVTTVNAQNETPLELCCSGEHRFDWQTSRVAEVLLLAVEEANDLAGYTRSLRSACAGSSYDVIAALLKSKFVQTDCLSTFAFRGATDVTLLMAACGNRVGGWRAVNLLLKVLPKDQVMARDSRGCNALEHACSLGNHDIVATLLKAVPELIRSFRVEWVYKNVADPLGVLQAILMFSPYESDYFSMLYNFKIEALVAEMVRSPPLRSAAVL